MKVLFCNELKVFQDAYLICVSRISKILNVSKQKEIKNGRKRKMNIACNNTVYNLNFNILNVKAFSAEIGSKYILKKKL